MELTGTSTSLSDEEQCVDGEESGHDQEDDGTDFSEGVTGVPGRLGVTRDFCGSSYSEGDGGYKSNADEVPVGGDSGNRVCRDDTTNYLTMETETGRKDETENWPVKRNGETHRSRTRV